MDSNASADTSEYEVEIFVQSEDSGSLTNTIVVSKKDGTKQTGVVFNNKEKNENSDTGTSVKKDNNSIHSWWSYNKKQQDDDSQSKKADNHSTGDFFNLLPWCLSGLMAVLLIAVLKRKRKKSDAE